MTLTRYPRVVCPRPHEKQMSRLEAFMVALGMILLGMAAARAEEPKLPEVIRGTGPEISSPARPAASRAQVAQVAGCDDTDFVAGFGERERRFGRGGDHGRPVHRSAPRARINDVGMVPAFRGNVSPTGR